MATVTSKKLADVLVPLNEGGNLFTIHHSYTLAASDASQNDDITVFLLPADVRIVNAILDLDSNLGGGATLKLRLGSTDLTGNTTAGGADTERMSAAVQSGTIGQAINVLVEDGNPANSTVHTVDVICSRD